MKYVLDHTDKPYAKLFEDISAMWLSLLVSHQEVLKNGQSMA